jgi:hypothetical protein
MIVTVPKKEDLKPHQIMILKQNFENGMILINFDKNFLNLIKFEKNHAN